MSSRWPRTDPAKVKAALAEANATWRAPFGDPAEGWESFERFHQCGCWDYWVWKRPTAVVLAVLHPDFAPCHRSCLGHFLWIRGRGPCPPQLPIDPERDTRFMAKMRALG